MLSIELLGVRGSIPSPGPHTVEFGGNTSCVLLTTDNDQELILDSGTGICKLNQRMLSHSRDINMLITHNHWDHIQGFPFFRPIFQKNRKINIVVGDVDCDDKNPILTQMSGSTFPIKYQQLPASINLDTHLARQQHFELNGFDIQTLPLNHPDGGSAYCISYQHVKVAYITDNELHPPGKVKTTLSQWQQFIERADLLIHDAQFVDADLTTKVGWGHSTIAQVVDLALAAKVKNLVLISHDPNRTDKELKQIEQTLQMQHGAKIHIECGREGRIFEFSDASVQPLERILSEQQQAY